MYSGTVEGLSTAEMMARLSYRDWNFDTVWDFNAALNVGYPILRALRDTYDNHPVVLGDVGGGLEVDAQDVLRIYSHFRRGVHWPGLSVRLPMSMATAESTCRMSCSYIRHSVGKATL